MRQGLWHKHASKKCLRLHSVAKETIAGYLFLVPWLVGFFLFMLGPILASLYLSFTQFDLLSAPQWIGNKNYLGMLQDPRYVNSIRVTLVYVFLSVPLKLAFALCIALLLNKGLRGLGIYRAIYYIPSLLGASVAVAILWRQIFAADGLLSQFLGLLGISDTGGWVARPDRALFTLIILAVWQFGSPMLIFLAGLKQIPQEFHEAAAVDGAGKIRRFFTITLPLLTPLVLFNLILQTIDAFQAFTPAFIVSGGTGGPADATLFYTLYIYQEGFGNLHMGYASAMAWVLLLAIAFFTAVAFLTSRYWVYYQDERD
ncbi:sugar ABC transporter permease [Ktedonosporobacter rubrisoli]|uniref:Sugar ABC transporter permease n=2 Tax=Ktedonosporobacter rubrisoli TaxID=2509675 RepID=A0A4V0Z0J7_KTERU|nr:sugar ABC transporter permease [Ktedonosporobacter rubrisoli]